jgi:hypothetical protein
MPNTPVTFDAVEVVRATLFGLTCRIDRVDVELGIVVPLAGTTVRAKGDVGRLVLPRWFALQEGLAVPDGA